MSIWAPLRGGIHEEYQYQDFYPSMVFGTQANAYSNFTATTWAWDWQFFQVKVIPALANLNPEFMQVAAQLVVDPGTDEAVDVRLRDNTNATTLASETGITSANYQIEFGPVPLTVNDPSVPIDLVFEWQESNGVNATAAKFPMVIVGEEVQ